MMMHKTPRCLLTVFGIYGLKSGERGQWEMCESIKMQVMTGKIMTPSGDPTGSSVAGMKNGAEGNELWGTG